MKNLICVIALALMTAIAAAQTAPSAIFYSDLTSAPNTGGQSNAGAFVTIHGKGFGSTQGTSYVTVGGGRVASYQLWSDSAITFQLGSAAKTGNIVVNVAGVSSNSVAFTVRAGNIYFVSTSGSDSSAGTYAAPWKSVNHAVAAMKAGDIVYLENGYTRTRVQANNAALVLSSSGTSAAPIAIVAYPNASASIGSTSSATTGVNVTGSNWVIAGLSLSGSESAIMTSNVTGLRVAGSNMTCPNGYGVGACVNLSGGSSVSLLGNQIHDIGSTTSTDLENYHSVWMTASNAVEVGWNQVLNTNGCNAIGAHSDSGMQYGFSIHDNFIQNTRCQAITLGTVDPSRGATNIYNNVVAKSGTGPAPGGTATGYGYSAITVGGGSSTPVQIYNNTIYDAGSIGSANAGAIRAFGAVKLTNNILYLNSGEQYVSSDSNVSYITGSNNLFFGSGNPLGVFANSVVANPLFVNATSGNFHLQSGSPAIDKGTTVQLASDFDGVLRPQGLGYDIGAYESVNSSSSGTGSLTASVSASPSTLTFGSVNTGQSATSTTVLTNTGTASVTLSGANSTNAAFKASGITFPQTLAAGQSTTVTVTFAPTTSGSQTGTIAVASNATNSPTNISVSGTGQTSAPVVSLSPSSLTFASQTVATTSATQNVTVSNTGTASLSISSIALAGSDFAMTNGCGSSLAAGSSCSIAVTFKPTATGTRTGTITLTDNASSGTQQVALTGTGAAAATATLSASTSAISFGSVNVGSNGTQSLIITNTGSASATISAISTGNAAFSVSGVTLPVTVAAGGSVTLQVAFAPSAASSYSSTMTITSNATNSTLTVSLTGTGATAALAHQVTVAWTESATVTGFNVYRSTTSGSGYTKLNSSLISSTSYVDTAVSAGATYYYVVTAVSSTGAESTYSPEASATVPTP